jgi:YHS domain-containing protein
MIFPCLVRAFHHGIMRGVSLGWEVTGKSGKENVAMAQPSRTVKDPVCLMHIDENDAVGYKDYQGRRFYFCAETCRQAFEQDPERYASQAA